MTHRLFIAIELDEKIRHFMASLQSQLKKSDTPVKWVNPDNMHLTLKFLGDVKIRMTDSIIETLQQSLGSTKRFNVELTQCGAFPSLQKPRVLWVGLNHQKENLIKLAQEIEESLAQIGYSKEKRKFDPHITLGRIKSSRNLSALTESIQNQEVPAGISQSINQVTLFKSTLTSQGPIYDALSSIELM